jgi:hypothetical protein
LCDAVSVLCPSKSSCSGLFAGFVTFTILLACLLCRLSYAGPVFFKNTMRKQGQVTGFGKVVASTMVPTLSFEPVFLSTFALSRLSVLAVLNRPLRRPQTRNLPRPLRNKRVRDQSPVARLARRMLTPRFGLCSCALLSSSERRRHAQVPRALPGLDHRQREKHRHQLWYGIIAFLMRSRAFFCFLAASWLSVAAGTVLAIVAPDLRCLVLPPRAVASQTPSLCLPRV